MARKIVILTFVLILTADLAVATIFGSVRGIVHDPQHRPVQGAMVMLKSTSSDWSKSTNTDTSGEFSFNPVPIGNYSVTVANPGFAQGEQALVVESGTQPVVHFQLNLAGAKETVNVSGTPANVPTDSATPTTLVDRLDIQQTPGASRTNSLAMITDSFRGATSLTTNFIFAAVIRQAGWLMVFQFQTRISPRTLARNLIRRTSTIWK